ncbi:hypothetical protein CFP65_6843 [Kitasatospora sp. MMS16-BH015]|uniref:SDR family oxidoreductase n=1 Tax=Kitasatospora sp. MMS16-BH015 TaxID=2018025 RepID=UPI000CA20FE4|nr:SDR family oxidoreductase [Kitasatospora sp. MMS16-BH015]AUG81475.1 hypothetical protein CFP65_6843 [Kitasatospora sp. MMS16-BH015]
MPPRPTATPTTLVLGAAGFLGRWLTLELLAQGHPVAAATTTPASAAALRDWLHAHQADTTSLTTLQADLTHPTLALTPEADAALRSVRDVHNLAARYRFGLSRPEAQAANTDGPVHALHWAARLPELRRFVHLSGYRISTATPVPHPLPSAEATRLYRKLGAYEASKRAGDSAVRTLAPQLGVPLSVVSPGVVIGHSVTGEAGQYIGLAPLVERLWRGRLPVLPATPRTFLPVVAVDHLARFLAAVPSHDHAQHSHHAAATPNTAPTSRHTVLDPATPALPALVDLLADHLGVPAPRRTVPVGLVRYLPSRLTGLDAESLSFLSEDRYDTTSADRLAAAAGLTHPPVADLLRRWATRLVAEDFGASIGPTP